MKPLHLLVISDPLARYLTLLERLPDATTVTVSDKVEGLAEAAPDADAVLLCTGRNDVLRPLWRSMRRLRWVHSMSAGVETVLFPELVESHVPFTNSRGVYKQSLAEFALAAMLYFAKDLPRMRRSQQARTWDQFDVEMLHGATLGIIGYGQIGRATARLAKAFGMTVLALARTSANDEYSDEMFTPHGVREVISRCDYVLVSAALTAETRGLVGADEIAAMKPSAVLINVGRGPVVEETALVRALESKAIRGAALDVFDVEPLPAVHPFWGLDNVLLSPHTADHTATWLQEAMEFFLGNFERFAAGQPLENIIDKRAGY